MKVNFKKISIHDAPQKSPGFLLWHVSTAWRGAIEKTLKSSGLTHPQFVVLATLGWLTKDGDLITQASIGKMAGLDPNTTSQIINGLENKNLLKRISSSDKRVKNPLLTPLGKQALSKALPQVEQADEAFFEHLSNEEMTFLITIFRKMVHENDTGVYEIGRKKAKEE